MFNYYTNVLHSKFSSNRNLYDRFDKDLRVKDHS